LLVVIFVIPSYHIRFSSFPHNSTWQLALETRVGKNPGFFKKTQPSGFFWFFLGFFGFFGFFWVFLGFLPRREGF
jgi:hypothetical protein